MVNTASTSRLTIGSAVVDIDRSCLHFKNREGLSEQQTLEPKVLELLIYFNQRASQLVSRDELIQYVWHGQVVGDNAINRAISQLRKALDKTTPVAGVIETVPRKGYVFSPSNQLRSRQESVIRNYQRKSIVISLLIGLLILLAGFFYFKLNIDSSPGELQLVIPTVETSLHGSEISPAVSPNGQWLAFIHQNEQNSLAELWIKKVGASESILISGGRQHHFNPVWSPDGKKIAFVTWNNRHERLCSVWIAHLDTELQTLPLVQSSAVIDKFRDCNVRTRAYLAWDSKSLGLFYNDRDGVDDPYRIFYSSLKTENRNQVSLPPQAGNHQGDFFIVGQPEKNRLAVIRYSGSSQSKVLILDMDNYHLISELDISPAITQLDWVGQSDEILVTSHGEWFAYDIFSTQRRSIFVAGQNSGQPVSSRDGRHIFYSTGSMDSELEIVSLTEKTSFVDEKINSSEYELNPFYSSNGNLYFISARTGQLEFWRREASGALQQVSKLPFSIDYTSYVVTPNEHNIIYQYYDEIYLWNIHQQKNTRLLNKSERAYVISWADDERFIFSSDKTGEWQLWLMRLGTGEQTQLTEKGGYSGKLNAQGNLYFSKLHQEGLWMLDSKSNEERLLIDDFSRVNWMNWELTRQAIYFHKANDRGNGVYRYDLESQHLTQIFPFDERHLNLFAVSPDEQQLAVTLITSSESKIYRLDVVNAESEPRPPKD